MLAAEKLFVALKITSIENPADAKKSLGKLDDEPYEPYEAKDFKGDEFLP